MTQSTPNAPGPVLPDFFGLDRESQDALIALAKIWRERAKNRAATRLCWK